MIDIKLLRDKPDEIEKMLRDRNVNFELTELLQIDSERRSTITELESLKMKTLLEGYRGSDPVDIDAFAQMASRFSLIAVELQEQICEIDINPVILGKDNCIAVDALISLHQQNN